MTGVITDPVEAEIGRLAKLPLLKYDRERADVARGSESGPACSTRT